MTDISKSNIIKKLSGRADFTEKIMELRELKYFLAVAQAGSISGAAEALYITQPSLSRQMQNLEREVGGALFERGKRRITLTERGKLLKSVRKRCSNCMKRPFRR